MRSGHRTHVRIDFIRVKMIWTWLKRHARVREISLYEN